MSCSPRKCTAVSNQCTQCTAFGFSLGTDPLIVSHMVEQGGSLGAALGVSFQNLGGHRLGCCWDGVPRPLDTSSKDISLGTSSPHPWDGTRNLGTCSFCSDYSRLTHEVGDLKNYEFKQQIHARKLQAACGLSTAKRSRINQTGSSLPSFFLKS